MELLEAGNERPNGLSGRPAGGACAAPHRAPSTKSSPTTRHISTKAPRQIARRPTLPRRSATRYSLADELRMELRIEKFEAAPSPRSAAQVVAGVIALGVVNTVLLCVAAPLLALAGLVCVSRDPCIRRQPASGFSSRARRSKYREVPALRCSAASGCIAAAVSLAAFLLLAVKTLVSGIGRYARLRFRLLPRASQPGKISMKSNTRLLLVAISAALVSAGCFSGAHALATCQRQWKPRDRHARNSLGRQHFADARRPQRRAIRAGTGCRKSRGARPASIRVDAGGRQR